MNLDRYLEICKMTQQELKIELKKELRKNYSKLISHDGYLYAKGNVPVMLLAHMDTVHRLRPKTFWFTSDLDKVKCDEGIGGDDRNGVYIILEIIKELKKEKKLPYILFTEDEEIGGVGAKKFTYKNYNPKLNFMIEFDRKGNNDAVFYDCDNKDFINFIEGFGYREEWGSYSDISTVAPHLGVAAVNLSSGYYNAHTKDEYVVLSEIDSAIHRGIEIIKTQFDKENQKKFEYVKKVYHYSKYYKKYGYGYGYGYEYGYGYSGSKQKKTTYNQSKYGLCEYCEEQYADGVDELNIAICKDCAEKNGMEKCDFCETYVYKDELKDLGGFKACPYCVSGD